MAIDTPARIAIIGAGPIGIEAALYARYLGYDVDLYERGRVGEHVRMWGHVKLFSPWKLNVSPLGVAALKSQDDSWLPAEDDTLLTGEEMLQRYWVPLAESDLVVDSVRTGMEVVALGRPHMLRHELPGDPARGDDDFLIHTRDAAGKESWHTADAVIDCSGVLGQHRWAGQGGLPALGEIANQPQIAYGLPDFNGAEGAKFAGRRVLLIGAGHSAATNALALNHLQPQPQVTWITRREPLASANGPLNVIDNDPLPERDRLARAANNLAAETGSGFTHWPATSLASLAWQETTQSFVCELIGDHAGLIEVDRIIANVGYRPDNSIAEELQLEISPATGAAVRHGAGVMTSEPNYYVLGAKSRGRESRFFISDGLTQIRDLFALIGDRADLDLYKTAR